MNPDWIIIAGGVLVGMGISLPLALLSGRRARREREEMDQQNEKLAARLTAAERYTMLLEGRQYDR